VKLRLALVLLLAACPREVAWTELAPDGGGFRVWLPGTPEASVKPAMPIVRPREVHIWTLDRGARGILSVNYYDLLPAAAAAAGAARTMVGIDCTYPFEGSKFAMEPPRPYTLQGATAVAIAGRAPTSEALPKGGYSEHRCILRGGRMYHLVAVGPDTAELRGDAEKVFASFVLVGGAQ
jgi:hypothetical protein